MQKKTDGFQEFSIQQAAKLSQSDAGQQLFALLQRDHGDQLQSAMEQAKAGDYTKVKETMQSLLASEQAQELLKKMQE